MPDDDKNKLPQNIQHLLMEIGEKLTLFRLFLLVMNTEWNVYPNIGEVGCDLILFNGVTNQKLKIEVKTRQRLYSTTEGKKINTAHFTLTEVEYNSCDFVICYWLEENAFFIVPKSDLKPIRSRDKTLYKFIVKRRSAGRFDEKSSDYLDKWDTIIRPLKYRYT